MKIVKETSYLNPEEKDYSRSTKKQLLALVQTLLLEHEEMRKERDAARYDLAGERRRARDISDDLTNALGENSRYREYLKEEIKTQQLRQVLAKALRDATNATPALLSFTALAVAALLRGETAFLKNPGIEDPDKGKCGEKTPGPVKDETYRLILQDARPDSSGRYPRIGCIKVVREMLGLGLREAKELTDPATEDPPREVILASGLSQEAMQRWDNLLRGDAPTAVWKFEPVSGF